MGFETFEGCFSTPSDIHAQCEQAIHQVVPSVNGGIKVFKGLILLIRMCHETTIYKLAPPLSDPS